MTFALAPLTLPFHDGRVVLHSGDCLVWLDRMAENSVDAIVTDPPYHLLSTVKRFAKTGGADRMHDANHQYGRLSRGFMGKSWDGGDIAFDPATWAKALRVLKPGGHMLAFAASKNAHRMICAIEDAGFEIRDTLQWIYGSGFPKSLDVSKAIDKAAGAKREKIVTGAAVKRMIPGADQHKEGWEKTNGRSFRPGVEIPATEAAQAWLGWGTALKPAYEPICLARKPLSEGTVAANVLRWGTGALNIDGCRVGTDESLNGGAYSGDMRKRDEYSSTDAIDGAVPLSRLSRGVGDYKQPLGRWPANVIHDGSDEVVGAFPESAGQLRAVGPEHGPRDSVNVYGDYGPRWNLPLRSDKGSAARFFFSAKADSDDRIGSKHPTVKPVDLMRWCIRLITPRGGLVLDPFAGTGTTGEAALLEGMRAWLIEREAEYQADIARRLESVFGGGLMRTKAKAARKAEHAGPLFADGHRVPPGTQEPT